MDMVAHLKERHLDTSRYNWSHDGSVASFLLFNLSGQLVGYHNYRPFAPKNQKNDPKTSRYYTYITNKAISPWGLDSFHWRKDILYITEGIFDACRLHNFGLPAIATLSNDPKKLRNWLWCLGRCIVAICDNDKAGSLLANSAHKVIRINGSKDLGDMEDEQIRSLLKFGV